MLLDDRLRDIVHGNVCTFCCVAQKCKAFIEAFFLVDQKLVYGATVGFDSCEDG
jgi:hypothetical protein